MMIRNVNMKHVHTIMNVDDSLSEEDAVNKALEIVAYMCNPELLHSATVFYIAVDDDGRIKLEMEV